jgi:thiol-disulfide isomerase/thioredoxin
MLLLSLGTFLARAAEEVPTLKIGDKAPKLQAGDWVQGTPVKHLEEGKAYLVEFWATWCGPCRVSIPHLNEIHNKYKDKGLVVIGQDCWERDETLVKPFIEKMGEKMTYRVALDDKKEVEKGKMAETWMAAAGRNGIPSAFLVDRKGLIAWIGHPMSLSEATIEEVLADKFDVQKAAKEYAEDQKLGAQLRPVQIALSQAMAKKDWATAEAKMNEALALLPEDKKSTMNFTRWNILLGKKDYAAANKLAEQMSETQKDNAEFQNMLAWRLVSDKTIENPDLALAEKFALRANDATQGKNANVLDTLARVRYLQGKKEEAIKLQEKAVELAEGPLQQNLKKSLESYKKDELPAAD